MTGGGVFGEETGAFGRPPPEEEGPRFAGWRTFMRLPAAASARGAKVAVVGAPFDGGTTYRAGARFGPAAIREASSMLYPVHYTHGMDVFSVLPGVDLGDVAVVPGDIARTLEAAERSVSGALAAGAVPIVLGGDHSVLLAELRAHRKARGAPMALVHMDSHSDMWDAFWGVRLTHGTVLRRALEEGLFDPAASCQVGLRGTGDSMEDLTQGRAQGLDLITADAFAAAGPAEAARRVRRRVGDRPAVLSFDVDVVDPAFAPGTGTPEVGGPSSREILQFLRALAGIEVAGADVVEVSPPYDHAQVTALLAAQVAFEEIALAARYDPRTGSSKHGQAAEARP